MTLHIVATVPVRIESSLNLRENWRKRANRNTSHRAAAFFTLQGLKISPSKRADLLPCTVTIIRIAPRALDDDNAVGGCKSVRDGVADWFGIDDADPRLKWLYAQERGAPNYYAVRIELKADAYHTVQPGRLMSDAASDEALRLLKAAKPVVDGSTA